LLSESRLQDQAEAKLYTVALADLDRQLADSTYVLPYQKLPLNNLARMQAKMAALGQRYEGLEALLLTKDAAYFSVETTTPSANCYLLKGRLGATAVENWEGIAAYKGGYFIINDKYTPARPYRTTLLYLRARK